MITAYNRITKKWESISPSEMRMFYKRYALTLDINGKPIYNGNRVRKYHYDYKSHEWISVGNRNLYFHNDWFSSNTIRFELIST